MLEKILKLFYGYVLICMGFLGLYTMYKLIVLNWFAEASIPTLILTSVPIFGFLIAYAYLISRFFKGKK